LVRWSVGKNMLSIIKAFNHIYTHFKNINYKFSQIVTQCNFNKIKIKSTGSGYIINVFFRIVWINLCERNDKGSLHSPE